VITIDQNTLLALLPPAGLALLAMLIVIVDITWPNRDRMVAMVAAVGILVLMALVVLIGPIDIGNTHIGILTGPVEVFGGAYIRDNLTALLDL
jgi:NADH:ubiquinone oxidoreductase subunit 2 (subunit N)